MHVHYLGTSTSDQPGGSVEQTEDPESHRRTPSRARANQFAATVEGYRAHAIADGLPFRYCNCMRHGSALMYLCRSTVSNTVCRMPSKAVTAMTLQGCAVCRPHGLFPPREPLLKELAEDPTAHPFDKHLAGESSPYELLKHGSWTSGDEAAQAGFDMRLFYKVRYPFRKSWCLLFLSYLAWPLCAVEPPFILFTLEELQ